MDFTQFQRSLDAPQPPEGLGSLLCALWYDGKGDWERSHAIAQEINTANGALIHAYLHRKEGDLFNADYWYRRAGEKRPDTSLTEEWERLVRAFLTDSV